MKKVRIIRVRGKVLLILIMFLVVVLSPNYIMYSQIKDNLPQRPIRFMTYNINQYYYNGNSSIINTKYVLNVINSSKADIIGLQEAEGKRISSSVTEGVIWLANQLHMYYFVDPNTNQPQAIGVSLLSRWPIVDQIVIPLPATDPGRVVIIAKIASPIGTITVLNTHLQTWNYTSERYKQVEKIISITSTMKNAIILGDFNTGPFLADKAFALLNSTYTDAWISAGRRWISAPNNNTDLIYTPNNRIDYIWVYGNFIAIKGSYNISGNSTVSDHVAVYCDITIPQNE